MTNIAVDVKVEKVSPLVRKLQIKVAAAVVENRYQQSLATVQKRAKIKGFRPGMVPLPVVKQFYGSSLRHQLFHDLIDESYNAAIRQESLRTVSQPKIDSSKHSTGAGEHDHALDEGQDLVYTAEVEIIPEIEVKGYTGLSLTKGKLEITDGEVDQVVHRVLESHADLAPVEGRPVIKGDHVDMEFKGGILTDKGLDAREGMSGSRVVEIGSDSLIPGFEDQLIGMKADQTKTFKIPFPGDYFEKELAGKDAEFTVTVKGLKEKKIPSLNDEFAKEAGYESVADFRAKGKESLTKQKGEEIERTLKSDLFQALIEKNPFDVPAALIQTQTRVLAQDVSRNLKNNGFTDAMIEDALQSEMPNLAKRAENQVRSSLILDAIAKAEKITLAESDLEAEYTTMAESMKIDRARLVEFYSNNADRRSDLEFRLREDKTVKFLLEKAKIKEVSKKA